MLRHEIWILTYTGKRFFIAIPELWDFCLEDIAHSLSQLCRFTGHTKELYSVAQHSVLVSRLVKPKNKLAALLHDAPEAYTNDLSRPIKSWLDGIKKLERQLTEAIYEKFKVEYFDRLEIRRADNIVGLTEMRDLMPAMDYPGFYNEKPMEAKIVPLCSKDAEALFLQEYYALTGRKDGQK